MRYEGIKLVFESQRHMENKARILPSGNHKRKQVVVISCYNSIHSSDNISLARDGHDFTKNLFCLRACLSSSSENT